MLFRAWLAYYTKILRFRSGHVRFSPIRSNRSEFLSTSSASQIAATRERESQSSLISSRIKTHARTRIHGRECRLEFELQMSDETSDVDAARIEMQMNLTRRYKARFEADRPSIQVQKQKLENHT